MDNPLDYNISHCPEEEVSNTKHGEPLKGEEQVDWKFIILQELEMISERIWVKATHQAIESCIT